LPSRHKDSTDRFGKSEQIKNEKYAFLSFLHYFWTPLVLMLLSLLLRWLDYLLPLPVSTFSEE